MKELLKFYACAIRESLVDNVRDYNGYMKKARKGCKLSKDIAEEIKKDIKRQRKDLDILCDKNQSLQSMCSKLSFSI